METLEDAKIFFLLSMKDGLGSHWDGQSDLLNYQ